MKFMKAVRVLVGLLMMAAGVITVHDLYYPQDVRIIPAQSGFPLFLGPALLVAGLSLVVLAFDRAVQLFTRRRIMTAGASILSLGLVAGVVALATDHGGDASWVNGMCLLGAGIFMVLPGFVLLVAGLSMKRLQK